MPRRGNTWRAKKCRNEMIFIRHALFWICTLLYHLKNILRWLWNFYQSLDSLLVAVWGFIWMKTFVSISCMFPVRIYCFNEGIFYSDMNRLLADLLSIFFLNTKHPDRKLFIDFLNLETSQMAINFHVLFHPRLLLNWSEYLVMCQMLAPQN